MNVLDMYTLQHNIQFKIYLNLFTMNIENKQARISFSREMAPYYCHLLTDEQLRFDTLQSEYIPDNWYYKLAINDDENIE